MNVRSYLRCSDCLSGAVIEHEQRERILPIDCALCGGRMKYLGQVAPDRRVVTTEYVAPCDARCTQARGYKCDCEHCLGRNHGSGLVVPIVTNSRGIRAVEPKIDSEKAVQRASEYRSAIDAVWCAIERKWAPKLGPEIRRRFSEGDWDVHDNSEIWRTARQLENIADVQVHKRRMQKLKELELSITS